MAWSTGDVRLLGSLAAAGVALFALERVLILWFFAERFTGVPWGERLHAFLVGGRMDVSLLGLLLIPVWLLIQASRLRAAPARAPHVALAVWVGVWTSLLAVGLIADVVHFDEVGSRIDGRALDDLRQPTVLVDAIFRAPWLVLPLGLLVVVGVLAGRGVLGRVRRVPSGTPRSWPRRVVAIAMLALLVVAARLRGDVAAWWGAAYFSDHYEANQLAMNGPYSVVLALIGEVRGDEAPEPIGRGMAQADALAAILPVIAADDEVMGTPESPLWRRTDTGRPRRDLNVVVVILESFEARAVEALGGRPGLSPNFARLVEGGVLFTRLHAAGTRSNRGLAAVVSGLPALQGTSPLRETWVQRGMYTLGDVLRGRGYQTFFVSGGHRHYDNLDAYALSNGFDRIVDKQDVVDPVFETEWGVSDEDLYRQALGEFDAAHRTGRPFCSVLITVSAHRPYRFPDGRIEPLHRSDPRAEIHDALRYSDWALGRFVDEAASHPWFRNTLFAFVADHGKDVRPVDGPDIDSTRIPLLLYGPDILGPPRRVDDVASQVDVPPTVLGVLGGEYEHCFFGSDLLGPTPPRRAPIEMGDMLLWREDDLVAAWVPGRDSAYYALEGGVPRRLSADEVAPERAARLMTRLRAEALLALTLPRESRYSRPSVRR